jgi:hypothetical protein
MSRMRDIILKTPAALAFALAVTVLASPGHAQGAGYKISAARAAAIHECSVRASRYVEHTWGDVEIYQYRACMAEHGQQE